MREQNNNSHLLTDVEDYEIDANNVSYKRLSTHQDHDCSITTTHFDML